MPERISSRSTAMEELAGPRGATILVLGRTSVQCRSFSAPQQPAGIERMR